MVNVSEKYRIVYKYGSEKLISIHDGMKPLPGVEYEDGNVFHIDNDAVKVLHAPIVLPQGKRRMSLEKVCFFMENDAVKRNIHPNGILYATDTGEYEGYSAEYKHDACNGIGMYDRYRLIKLPTLIEDYHLHYEDFSYYTNINVRVVDCELWNVLFCPDGMYFIDKDPCIIGEPVPFEDNISKLRMIMSSVVPSMVRASTDNTHAESDRLAAEISTSIYNNLRSPAYKPRDFERDFRGYNTIDEYVQDRGIKVKIK